MSVPLGLCSRCRVRPVHLASGLLCKGCWREHCRVLAYQGRLQAAPIPPPVRRGCQECGGPTFVVGRCQVCVCCGYSAC